MSDTNINKSTLAENWNFRFFGYFRSDAALNDFVNIGLQYITHPSDLYS